jgi:hypothetical protein
MPSVAAAWVPFLPVDARVFVVCHLLPPPKLVWYTWVVVGLVRSAGDQPLPQNWTLQHSLPFLPRLLILNRKPASSDKWHIVSSFVQDTPSHVATRLLPGDREPWHRAEYGKPLQKAQAVRMFSRLEWESRVRSFSRMARTSDAGK